MPAQRMQERLSFQKRVDTVDDYGNTSGDFAEQFIEPAEIIVPRLGSEGVVAARLAGQQPVIVRVRLNTRTRQINAGWRAVDARNPAMVLALTAAAVDREQNKQWLEIPATVGIAA
jgi:head-tail adaptor